MLVPLAAVKQYLRVDTDDEDDLLMHFTETAEQICTALLRVKKLSKVEDQAIVRVAILAFRSTDGGLLGVSFHERTAASNHFPASRHGYGR